jgi:hypothetical protein
MTLTLDRPQADTTIPRGLLRVTLRQHRPGLAVLGAMWLLCLAALCWFRFGEYRLTQLTLAHYGNVAMYWYAHWYHVDYFNGDLFWGFVVATLLLYAALLITCAASLRRDLRLRLHVTLWTQAVSPAQWLLARLAVFASIVVLGFGSLAALTSALLHWAMKHQIILDGTQSTWLLRLSGPSLVTGALLVMGLGVLFSVVPGGRPTRVLSFLGLFSALCGLGYPVRTLLLGGSSQITGSVVQQRFPGVFHPDSVIKGNGVILTGYSHTVLTGIDTADYWQHQLLTCAYDLTLAAGAVLLALHLLRRRAAA